MYTLTKKEALARIRAYGNRSPVCQLMDDEERFNCDLPPMHGGADEYLNMRTDKKQGYPSEFGNE